MKTQVILEIGSNFESLQDIKDSIDYAKSVGAIPKLQCFQPEEITNKDSQPEYYEKLRSVAVPREWIKDLKGSGVFYSVFGMESLAFLEKKISPSLYKIASGKATDKELIQAVARTGKQTYLSVGGCTLNEIRQATNWFREACSDLLWWSRLTLMHCVVQYPAQSALLGNLRDRIAGSKLIPWGYSDHTTDIVAPVMAVTLGAVAIEKHFSIRPMSKPDSGHSLYMPDFTKMVENIKLAENHMQTQEQPTEGEIENLRLARR
jgi:sialic acid synthase SpsE